MKHNLCVENFDFYHMIYEYLDDNHVIYAQKEKIDPRIRHAKFPFMYRN